MRYNADGSLDAGFDTDGKVSVDFSENDQLSFAHVALQSDGKILVSVNNLLDSLNSDNGDVDPATDGVLMRFNSTGSLDSSFGSSGIIKTHFELGGNISDIAVQSSGEILLTGYVNSATHNSDFFLARYNSNGNLDANFDSDGLVTASLSDDNSNYFGNCVVIQPDSKIIVAGRGSSTDSDDFALARYNTDGSLDTGFGVNGKVTTDFTSNQSASDAVTKNFDIGLATALQPDGKILVAGGSNLPSQDFFSNQNLALACYNTDGSLDTGFGDGGKIVTDLGGSFFAQNVIVQTDGKILVAGIWYNYNFAISSSVIVRYNTDGSLDTGFDGDGLSATDFDSSGYTALQSDGKILLAGSIRNSSNYTADFALARFNTDGSLDADTTTPTVSTFSPVDEAGGVGVSDNIVLTFDEAIQKGTGTIVLTTSSGRIVETFKVASSKAISISGDTLTINPSKDLSYGAAYKLKIASGAITDAAHNKYAGTNSFNFTTTDTLTTSASSYTMSAKDPQKLTYSGTGDFVGTGNKVANNITGGNGNDTLNGGLGKDTLTGGEGSDQFVFNSKAGKTNVDTIADFTVGTDKIVLDNVVFKKLASAMTSDQLVNGAVALDNNDYLLYDSVSGSLFYDADGSGKGKAVEIAVIGTSLNLSADDFVVN